MKIHSYFFKKLVLQYFLSQCVAKYQCQVRNINWEAPVSFEDFKLD